MTCKVEQLAASPASELAPNLASDEDGAVTVDWVVLTASVVALGAMAVAAITGNLGTVGSKVNSFMASQTVSTTF